MINSVRGKHSSPGIYYKETEIAYSAKSLGITSLGLAGETLKGPAFEPISISDWNEFQYYFGGTSIKKFKDSQYPKYELPFIAKSYLTESKQLEVVRVIGLSGYNAGPAWAITASGEDGKKYIVAILRSKGHYEKYAKGYDFDECTGSSEYDKLVYHAIKVEIEPYVDLNKLMTCTGPQLSAGETGNTENFKVSTGNLGRFVLNVTEMFADGNTGATRYAVSLNSGDKDYIYDVLGSDPDNGSSALFVEAVFDVALAQYIAAGKIEKIDDVIEEIPPMEYNPICDPVLDEMTIASEDLRRSNLEQTFLYTGKNNAVAVDPKAFVIYESLNSANEIDPKEGAVYQVKYGIIDASAGTLGYKYVPLMEGEGTGATAVKLETSTGNTIDVVLVNSYRKYFTMNENGVVAIVSDMNNYKERFRAAVTPWFVSQLVGNGVSYDIKRLFRFTTISDGNAANHQVKISIERVHPDNATFNVVIRDYYDSDLNQTVLEKYNNCNMDPSSSSFIGKKIGTTDGSFVAQSKYVTVEVAEDDTIKNLVPCGFLGYPMGVYKGVEMMDMKYNTEYDPDIRVRKQYFGMSDIVGVDIDVLNYKGVVAYKGAEYPDNGYTHGFHLDVKADKSYWEGTEVEITVDGESGYEFDTVGANTGAHVPEIGSESEMYDTVYEDINTRKFTAYPYGGFDGWDIYRGSRTTGDEFKANKYKGSFIYGDGKNFTKNFDGTGLGLENIRAISSDYYAFLAGYRQFANPEAVDINLFATPGIDLFNNVLLTEDAMNVIEDDEDGRKGDALYIPTIPDKPFGASDAEEDMYTADDIVDLLESTNVDTTYAASYYPWVKYYDNDSGTYINLPVTKDVMRDFAYTDNTAAPWFASAGINRGPVNCVKAHHFTKQAEEDTLYDGRINPVKTFAADGVKIWGNKTLSTTEGPLNRINVRRLMIRVKKLITIAARQLIFEQNDNTLRRQFQSLVEPILANVMANRGITDYRLEVQQSVECEDEHELSATIWIKPTPTLEYISINFNITSQCVTFDE